MFFDTVPSSQTAIVPDHWRSGKEVHPSATQTNTFVHSTKTWKGKSARGGHLSVIIVIEGLVFVQSGFLINVWQPLPLLNSDLLEGFPLSLLPHTCLDLGC